MTEPPVEARCDHCKQTRPLFLYEPEHNLHLNPALMAACRWCNREKQSLLCVRCWGAERELEESDPGLNQEAETWAQICATNARADARRQARAEADRETCEGIARATAKTDAA